MRRVNLAKGRDPSTVLDELQSQLRGFSRTGPLLHRASVFLKETISVEDRSVVYAHAPSLIAYTLLTLTCLTLDLLLAFLVGRWAVAFFEVEGGATRALIYAVAALLLYAPISWVFGAIAARGSTQERRVLDVLMQLI
ncbi:MAG: hypothetical protein AAF658_01360 [Myxococcota bacterium]